MFRWYAVNTYSGHENKVKQNLEHRRISLGQENNIRQIVIPTEQVQEMKDGQKQTKEQRTMPGYLLVNMNLTDDSWQLVKNTPVGPALGQHGVNIMEFCKAFNAQTQQDTGTIIPVEITVYEDRSFTFITKTPPAAVLIKEAAGIEKGSGEPNREKVGRASTGRGGARSPLRTRRYEPVEAVALIKETAGTKFDETVEVHIRLGV